MEIDVNNLQKNIGYDQLSNAWNTNFENFPLQILRMRAPNITSSQKTGNFRNYNTKFFLFYKWPIQCSDGSKW